MKNPTIKSGSESREIIDGIRRLVQAIRLASGDSEKSVGLSAAQLFVLHNLSTEKGLSINELAARTLTHQSSVSVIVQKLETKKLVRRTVSGIDARKYVISLTKKGSALVKKAPQSIQEKLINALGKMHHAERRELSVTLNIFLSKAGISDKTAPLLFDDTHLKKPKKRKTLAKA